MNRSNTLEKFEVNTVVELAAGIAGVQSPDGSLVPTETLGPGIVKGHKKGVVRVFWTTAQLDTWVEPPELEPAAPGTHLIIVYRCNGHGQSKPGRSVVTARADLSHNWNVEPRPGRVIRTIRSDGLAWTFDLHPVSRRIQPHGTILEDALAEEDHAEALAVAELAAS